jgi:pyridoxamine 5'-phosphate oxidase
VNDRNDQRTTRREYGAHALSRAVLAPDPHDQFEAWFNEASDSGVLDVTAMALATATPEGAPSVRVVLLKHFDHDGFCWYSDGRSRKGAELAANPRASLMFHWRELNRQIRIDGIVARLSGEASDAYFASRPRASQLAAAASVQSAPVASRAELEARYGDLDRTLEHVRRPTEWGGYRLTADAFEFWQGRPARLHDRFRYVPAPRGAWTITRLQP